MNAAKKDAARPAIKFRRGQPRLRPNTDTKDVHGGAQRFKLTIKRKTLTLKQWAGRGQSDIAPTDMWRRLKAGFPLEEAVGGPDVVARAVAFVGWREARAIRGDAARERRSKRKPVSRQSANRRPKIMSNCTNHA